jgi:hypothetical protein
VGLLGGDQASSERWAALEKEDRWQLYTRRSGRQERWSVVSDTPNSNPSPLALQPTRGLRVTAGARRSQTEPDGMKRTRGMNV